MIHHRTADQVRKFDVFKLIVTLILLALLIILWFFYPFQGETQTVSAPDVDEQANSATQVEGDESANMDNPAPATPEVKIAPPTIDLSTGTELTTGELILNGTGEPDSEVDIVIDGQVVGTTTVGNDGTWTYTTDVTEPGQHDITVQTTDANGEVVSSEPVSVSFTAPQVAMAEPTIDLSTGTELTTGEVTLNGTGEPGSEIDIVIDGQVVGTTTVGDDGTWTYTTDVTEPGQHDITVQTTDANGQVVSSEPVSVSFTAPQVAMAEPTIDLPAGTELTTGEVTLSGTGESGSEIDIVIDGQVVGTTTVGDDGTWTYTTDVTEPGQHDITVQTTDANGQVMTAAKPVTISVAAPTSAAFEPTFIFPANGADVLNGELTLTGTGEPGEHVEILDNDTAVGEAEIGNDGEWHFILEPSEGNHQFTARPVGSEVVPSNNLLVRMVDPRDEYDCTTNPGLDRGSSYIVGTCDTLSLIAAKAGLSFEALSAANPQIENLDLIYPGEILTLPR